MSAFLKPSLLLQPLLFLVFLWVSASFVERATAGQEDPVPRTENLHLDCSSCLAVAAVLGQRMNDSLKQAPGSYLVSHRLDRESSERRRLYKTGELRGVEVLDDMCRHAIFKDYCLRLNAKTKVRGFHILNYGKCRNANREALMERTEYPSSTSKTNWFKDKLGTIKMPLAHFYTKHEHDTIGNEGFYNAPKMACARFLDGHDDELSELIREADWLSEVEEQLCGLHWGSVVSHSRRQIHNTLNGGNEKDEQSDTAAAPALWKGFAQPISPVCQDADAVKASAIRDQRRWFAWSFKRKQKRRAAREARRAHLAKVPVDVEKKTDGGDSGDL